MLFFSKFAHAYKLGNDVALYHSLRMKPVYLSHEKYKKILSFIQRNKEANADVLPETIKKEIEELCKYKILIFDKTTDDRILAFVRSKIPTPRLNVCYFILTEQCNLACRYCFLGNNNTEKRKLFLKKAMSKDVAEKGLNFFLKHLDREKRDANEKFSIIFYGGEPLLNFEVLEYVAEKINAMNDDRFNLSVVTNGLLLDRKKLLRLRELHVSIAVSIDGGTEKANEMRITPKGTPVYQNVLDALSIANEENIPVSLSVTLTEETIKDGDGILNLIKKFNIKGLGFNILLSDTNTKLPTSYNDDAAQFIIDMFVKLRTLGIYEDRIMRKLKAFANSQVYFSDCAATAAAQIVVVPDGSVGICHGCMADKKYFPTNVDDEKFDPSTNNIYKEWATLTPVNKPYCLSCEALGICGGGCAINAQNLIQGNSIHSIDRRFCVHAKKTLEFFLSDLYRIITGKQERCLKI